jgi:hypothetical protein
LTRDALLSDFEQDQFRICDRRFFFRFFPDFAFLGLGEFTAFYRCPSHVFRALVFKFSPSHGISEEFMRLLAGGDVAIDLPAWARVFGPTHLSLLIGTFADLSDWTTTVYGITFPVQIVCRRRFCFVASARSPALISFAACPLYPSVLLNAVFASFSPPTPPGSRAPSRIVRPERLAELREKIVKVVDLVEVLERAEFRFGRNPERYVRRFQAVTMSVMIGGLPIAIELDEDKESGAILNRMAREASQPRECVASIIQFTKVFLPVDGQLWMDVLGILERMMAMFQLELPAIFAAMQTARIGDDGNASIAIVLYGEMTEIHFSVPFSRDAPVTIRRGGHPQQVAIDALFDALRPYDFDF